MFDESFKSLTFVEVLNEIKLDHNNIEHFNYVHASLRLQIYSYLILLEFSNLIELSIWHAESSSKCSINNSIEHFLLCKINI